MLKSCTWLRRLCVGQMRLPWLPRTMAKAMGDHGARNATLKICLLASFILHGCQPENAEGLQNNEASLPATAFCQCDVVNDTEPLQCDTGPGHTCSSNFRDSEHRKSIINSCLENSTLCDVTSGCFAIPEVLQGKEMCGMFRTREECKQQEVACYWKELSLLHRMSACYLNRWIPCQPANAYCAMPSLDKPLYISEAGHWRIVVASHLALKSWANESKESGKWFSSYPKLPEPARNHICGIFRDSDLPPRPVARPPAP